MKDNKWEKLPPVDKKDIHIGCSNCSTAARVAHLNMTIAVGFGCAYIEKDGVMIYDGERDYQDGKEPKVLQEFEDMAKQDPDHDWQLVKHGPMHGETFQRHSDDNWVCVASENGFA